MLPPGPRAPLAVQTVQWITQPTALLRRAQARHGEPFTLRMAWSDAPMVLTSDPEEVRRVVFGTDDAARRDALRRALDMTQSTPRLVAMALAPRDLGGVSPYGRFLRAVAEMDALLERRIAAAPADGSILAVLRAAE